jgi:hypothetical protein
MRKQLGLSLSSHDTHRLVVAYQKEYGDAERRPSLVTYIQALIELYFTLENPPPLRPLDLNRAQGTYPFNIRIPYDLSHYLQSAFPAQPQASVLRGLVTSLLPEFVPLSLEDRHTAIAPFLPKSKGLALSHVPMSHAPITRYTDYATPLKEPDDLAMLRGIYKVISDEEKPKFLEQMVVTKEEMENDNNDESD